MRLNWRPHVYQRLIIDHRFHQYLILNADYASWVFLDEEEFFLFQALRDGQLISDLCGRAKERWGEKVGQEKVRDLLGRLRVNQIIFPSPRDREEVPSKVSYLETLYINVTKACNLRCPYCYAMAGIRSEGELTQLEILNLIDESTELAVKRVVFTGGEPLLRKDLFSMARYVRESGLLAEVITNGTLINQDNVDELVDSFDSIAISLDASTEEMHQSLRGPGSFQPVNEALSLLSHYHKKLVVNTVITRHNYLDIPQLSQLIASMGFYQHNLFMHLPLGRGKDDGLSLTLPQINEMRNLLLDSLESHKRTDFVKRRIRSAPPLKGMAKNSCGSGLTEIIVDSSGFLYPCRLLQMEELKVGNIRDSSLKDLYFSHKMKSCRLLNLEQIKECYECAFARLCAGSCRAMHYAFSQDLFKNTEWICQYLKEELLINLWLKEGFFPRVKEEVLF